MAIPFPPGLWFNLAEEARSVPHFTIRERHVGGWMAEGKTDAEIADILTLGVETVKTHVKSLLEKTGTENRNAFVAWVWRDRIAAEFNPAPPRKPVKYT